MKLKRILLSIIGLVLVALLGLLGYSYYLVSSIPKDDISKIVSIKEDPNVLSKYSIPTNTNSLGVVDSVKNDINKKSDGNVTNILLMGIDSEDGVGRSDAIMIVSVDKKNKLVKLSSLQRDSYVYIAGHGMTKLNHAYAYGGPQLSIRTVNTNMGMDIQDYVSVNFNSMPKIINSLGGIDMKLSAEEAKIVGVGSKSGTYHLNGDQSLSFSRIRKIDTDYERTSRQRRVVEYVIRELMKASPLKYPSLMNQIIPLTKTSLPNTTILSLGTTVAAGGYDIKQAMFPDESYAKGTMISGTWYFIYDKDTLIKKLHDFIFN